MAAFRVLRPCRTLLLSNDNISSAHIERAIINSIIRPRLKQSRNIFRSLLVLVIFAAVDQGKKYLTATIQCITMLYRKEE